MRGKPSTCNKTEEGCARAAAKLWKVPFRSLIKDEGRKSKLQRSFRKGKQYRHISWHSSKNLWVVMDASTYVGCHKNLKSALSIATAHFKCTVRSLRLSAPRKTGDNKTDFCNRIAFMLKVYRGRLPLDVEDLIANNARARKIPPSMLLPYILCKFPSHRQAAFDTATKFKDSSDVCKLFAEFARRVSKCPLPDHWVRNVGRKNMHHGTFMMFARGQLGLVSKVSPKSKIPMQRCLTIGKSLARYAISTFTPKLRQRLEAVAAFGEQLRAAKAPRTVKEWIDISSGLSEHADKTPGMSNPYRKLWVIRCALILKMRQAGIQRLKLSDETVRDFQGVVPDQKNLLAKAAGGSYMLHRKVRDVFEECSYSGPPELFSMWACLIADRSVSTTSLSWLTKHEDELRSCFESIVKRDQLAPHPGVLVEELKRTLHLSSRSSSS